MGKKVIYLIIFIVAIAGVVGIVMFFNNATANRDNTIAEAANNLGGKTKENKESNTIAETTNKKLATTITELEDGTLYQIGDKQENVDIVIGDNLFDTQLSDISLNFSQYEGKTIEIEGMYMKNEDKLAKYCYTFVGRYSNSNLCQYCPQGYSYFEYEWHGDKTPRLVDEITWIKIRGTLTKGKDKAGEYYYIKANSMEVMNERGQDTVNN